MISVIIPTYNNKHILYAHLDKYDHQTAKEFEVIVVNDGGEYIEYNSPFVRVINNETNRGPAVARNVGAREAVGDTVLFVGDDCFPQRDLILRHQIHHYYNKHTALQGYSPFHPDVLDTRFMQWLDRMGMQANWSNLRTNTGWKTDATGFLLTTNFSMNRDDFLNFGGFPEEFPTAAWEDVAFGHELRKQGYATSFDPTAINLHYHKHTLESFMQRQYKEGRSRVFLATRYPETAMSLLNPNDLRGSDNIVIEELAATLKKLQFVPQANIDEQLVTLMLACSFTGVKQSLVNELQAIKYVNDAEYPAFIVSAHKAIESNNNAFVHHCINWALQKEPNNWATYGFVGECYLAIGDRNEALFAFRKALEMKHDNNWVDRRYNELKNDQQE
jgi:glycosyltransferase involved in cell wall biosynthesis